MVGEMNVFHWAFEMMTKDGELNWKIIQINKISFWMGILYARGNKTL
jgi:hypothetical protein